jgi:hypothetical protein
MPKPPTDWTACPLVFIPMPACPACGAVRPITVRSEAGGDGSVSRKSVCRKCSTRFVIVAEPPLPEFGKAELDTRTIGT